MPLNRPTNENKNHDRHASGSADVRPGENKSEAGAELLVAYLDGELSEAESTSVEEKISADRTIRKEVEALDRVWNILSKLPHTTLNENFAQTTIELVTLQAEQDLTEQTQELQIVQRRSWGWIISLFLGTAVSVFFLCRLLLGPTPTEILLADLPLIQQLDNYRQVTNIGFLRQLHTYLERVKKTSQAPPSNQQRSAQNKFRLLTLSTKKSKNKRDHFISVLESGPNNRRKKITHYSNLEKEQLQHRLENYLAMSPQERTTWKTFHQEIINAPDREILWDMLFGYTSLLKLLPEGERVILQDLSSQERLKKISHLTKKHARRLIGELYPLSKADQKNLRQVFTARYAAQLKKMATKFSSESITKNFYNAILIRREISREMYPFLRSGKTEATPIYKIISQLSNEAKQTWEQTSGTREKMSLLRVWINEALPLQPTNLEKLEEQFLNRPTEEQENFLNSPPEIWGELLSPPHNNRHNPNRLNPRFIRSSGNRPGVNSRSPGPRPPKERALKKGSPRDSNRSSRSSSQSLQQGRP